MKRWLIIVSILLAVSIEGNFWLAGELREEQERHDKVGASADPKTSAKQPTGKSHNGADGALEASAQKLEDMLRQIERLKKAAPEPGIASGGLRAQLRALKAAAKFSPPGTSIMDARSVRGSDLPTVVVQWLRGEGGTRGSGLYVWQASEASTTPTEWRLIFRIEVDARGGRVRVGSPGAEQIEETEARGAIYFETGDATGDGHPDILVLEGNTGSGGCGTWRLIALRGTRIESIYRREGCEADLRIQREMLRVESAIYPKGCKSIHGCGRRRTWLRWTGTGWDKVSSRVISRS